jgi:hypothetical protein
MGRMHHAVLENNVYRWAGTLISTLARSNNRSDRADTKVQRAETGVEIAVGK